MDQGEGSDSLVQVHLACRQQGHMHARVLRWPLVVVRDDGDLEGELHVRYVGRERYEAVVAVQAARLAAAWVQRGLCAWVWHRHTAHTVTVWEMPARSPRTYHNPMTMRNPVPHPKRDGGTRCTCVEGLPSCMHARFRHVWRRTHAPVVVTLTNT